MSLLDAFESRTCCLRIEPANSCLKTKASRTLLALRSVAPRLGKHRFHAARVHGSALAQLLQRHRSIIPLAGVSLIFLPKAHPKSIRPARWITARKDRWPSAARPGSRRPRDCSVRLATKADGSPVEGVSRSIQNE